MAIYESILDVVGDTPVVPLKKVGAELKCNLWGKCEFLNPGGSLKDRIGVRMVREAEKSGRIEKGDKLIEPTSGNTGVGMAMAAAASGYQMAVTMPEKMSMEKEFVLKALGAEVVRTPTEAAHDDPDSLMSVAARMAEESPNNHILDQYGNPNNPDAHYYGTGVEILKDFPEDLAMVVIGVGTGGTITGIARRIKEEAPHVQIVGVDPYGSILAGPGEIFAYDVEGIGYDFIPEVLDNSLVDKYVKSADKESFEVARRLIREEGLLCGGSSGAVVWAALQVAKDVPEGKHVVCILADNIRNYLTKFINDEWMQSRGHM